MGLFGLRKKGNTIVPPIKKQNPANESEFDRDVRELLSRSDIMCRNDVCEAEYKKALSLLDNPTQERIHRAYDLMGNLASKFEFIPAILWMGDFLESTIKNLQQAVFFYKKAADLGDGNGARNYADMLMAGKGVQSNRQEAMKYYSLAASKGVPEAAFVMGEFYRTSGDRSAAMKSYQQALKGGYSPAQQRINQMNNGSR